MRLVHHREELGGLVHRQEVEVHAEVAAAGLGQLQPVEPLLRAGQHDAAREMHAAALAGDRLDLLVELDRVLLELRHIGVAVDRVHAARGVPGGARRELGALDQHHVAPARLREVVEHAGTHDSAADHHRFRVRLHAVSPCLVFVAPPRGAMRKVVGMAGRHACLLRTATCPMRGAGRRRGAPRLDHGARAPGAKRRISQERNSATPSLSRSSGDVLRK